MQSTGVSMGEVVKLSTPAARVAYALSFVKPAPQRELQSAEGLALLDEWIAHATRLQAQVDRLEMLHLIATIHLRTSDTLLDHALAELERLRTAANVRGNQ